MESGYGFHSIVLCCSRRMGHDSKIVCMLLFSHGGTDADIDCVCPELCGAVGFIEHVNMK